MENSSTCCPPPHHDTCIYHHIMENVCLAPGICSKLWQNVAESEVDQQIGQIWRLRPSYGLQQLMICECLRQKYLPPDVSLSNVSLSNVSPSNVSLSLQCIVLFSLIWSPLQWNSWWSVNACDKTISHSMCPSQMSHSLQCIVLFSLIWSPPRWNSSWWSVNACNKNISHSEFNPLIVFFSLIPSSLLSARQWNSSRQSPQFSWLSPSSIFQIEAIWWRGYKYAHWVCMGHIYRIYRNPLEMR